MAKKITLWDENPNEAKLQKEIDISNSNIKRIRNDIATMKKKINASKKGTLKEKKEAIAFYTSKYNILIENHKKSLKVARKMMSEINKK